ncbi:MAG TPA: glycosyltransferase family 4 protein [Chloroflexota bacterium]|jgi:glycosyltransferase involved in cell wall biosynthesis|nr:glycosyltransferase family 4 protein [Chloroflexota bacterium]
MRILLFSSTYPPLIGGVETVTHRLARELKDRGHDVTVVTNRYPRSLAGREVIDGIAVTRRLYPNLLPSPGRRRAITIAKQVLSIPLGAFELMELVREFRRVRPDVVNIHYFSYPAAYALLAARLARLPVVLCFHGSDAPGVPYPATYPWAARWACRMAHRVICCSDDLASYLHRSAAASTGKVSVSHYGVDAEGVASAGTLAGQEPFMLLPARLVEKKGVEIAIRAMAELGRSGVDARMVVIGSGPLDAELRALALDLGLDNNVIFAGSVEHEVAREMMARAQFVVVPSHWEAFGMVCLEAMAAGRAIVGCDNGGIAEIVVAGETGLLVAPRDPSALAAAMALLLADPDRAEAMGHRGRDRVEASFTWAQMVDRYESRFRDAVEANGSSNG